MVLEIYHLTVYDRRIINPLIFLVDYRVSTDEVNHNLGLSFAALEDEEKNGKQPHSSV